MLSTPVPQLCRSFQVVHNPTEANVTTFSWAKQLGCMPTTEHSGSHFLTRMRPSKCILQQPLLTSRGMTIDSCMLRCSQRCLNEQTGNARCQQSDAHTTMTCFLFFVPVTRYNKCGIARQSLKCCLGSIRLRSSDWSLQSSAYSACTRLG